MKDFHLNQVEFKDLSLKLCAERPTAQGHIKLMR